MDDKESEIEFNSLEDMEVEESTTKIQNDEEQAPVSRVQENEVVQEIDNSWSPFSMNVLRHIRKYLPGASRQKVPLTCKPSPFPLNVLRLVVQYLPGSCRKKVRLTCKQWYSACCENEKMVISGPEVAHKYLENCRMRNLNLDFTKVDVGSFPPTVWEKLGTRIYSLKFTHCKFGSKSLENIIIFCDNMRSLELNFKLHCLSDLRISPEAIEKMDVRREKLETLYFSAFPCLNSRPMLKVDVNVWIGIFKSLYRIYPNVIHHGASIIKGTVLNAVGFSFSKVPNESDQETLAKIMAFSIAEDDEEKTLDTLFRLRLKTVSVRISVLFKLTSIYYLFTDRKELEAIDLQMGYRMENEKGLILHIIDQCPNLNRLIFNSPTSIEALKFSSEDEWFLIRPRFKELSLQECVWKNPSSIELNDKVQTTSQFLSFMRVFSGENIRQLNLMFGISNDILQGIFQHMTNLTSLEMTLRDGITDYGFNGWCFVANARIGASIQWLHNLERLTIHIMKHYKPKITDKIYDEFNFPKLRYFHCITPKEPSILLQVVKKTPLLTEINLTRSHSVSSKLLIDLCRRLKKLRILHVGMFYIDDIEQIFKVCRTLQFVHTYVGMYCYEPGTEKLVYKQINSTNQIISILNRFVPEASIDSHYFRQFY